MSLVVITLNKMHIIKKILKIIGALIVLVALCIGALVVYASIDKTDTFYLREAELANPSYLYEMEDRLKKEQDYYRLLNDNPSVYIHRIKKGTGLILAFRWYSNGKLWIIDDEGFEKLTIWLAMNAITKETSWRFEDSDKLIGVYTKGGSAWPRNACSGYLRTGTVTIKPIGKVYKVQVNAQLEPQGVRTLGDWGKAQNIKMEFSTKEIEHKNLTHWLGKASDHPYKETYRR